MGLRQATRNLLHETVIEAIRALLEQRPWSAISMAEIARAAGVSRQTLYNEFGDRSGLAAAYAQWAADAFLDDIAQVVADSDGDPERALRRGLETFLTIAHTHPLVRAVEATAGIEGVAAFVAADVGPPLVLNTTERLTEIIVETFPELPRDAVALFAEAVVRLAISYMTAPTTDPVAAARRVTAVLLPYVTAITGTGAGGAVNP